MCNIHNQFMRTAGSKAAMPKTPTASNDAAPPTGTWVKVGDGTPPPVLEIVPFVVGKT